MYDFKLFRSQLCWPLLWSSRHEMKMEKASQKTSQKRFVILLIVVELIVCVLFCVYVRYDDSIDARQDGQFDLMSNGFVRIFFWFLKLLFLYAWKLQQKVMKCLRRKFLVLVMGYPLITSSSHMVYCPVMFNSLWPMGEYQLPTFAQKLPAFKTPIEFWI